MELSRLKIKKYLNSFLKKKKKKKKMHAEKISYIFPKKRSSQV